MSIRNVFTRDGYRRAGVANALVQYACRWCLSPRSIEGLEEADRRRVTKAFVLLFVEPENKVAFRMYSKAGFTVDGLTGSEWANFDIVPEGLE